MSDYKPHVVIDEQKNIILPEQLKNHMVQYDHNVKTITFDCPRYSDGRDLSTMRIYVSYFRQSGAKDADYCENIIVDSKDANRIHFEWIPKRSATLEHGILAFLICAEKEDAEGNQENAWHTKLCKGLKIAEGMDCLKAVIEKYPTIITYLLTRVEDIELKASKESITDNINEALQMAEASGRFGKVKTVNGFEPDENGNVTIEAGGASSWNDLQDKPFDEAITETEMIPEFLYGFSEGAHQFETNDAYRLTAGETYKVIWNGEAFECEALHLSIPSFGMEGTVIGNIYKYLNATGLSAGVDMSTIPQTDEPFLYAVLTDTSGEQFVLLDVSCMDEGYVDADKRFSLYHVSGEIKKLETKFLPKEDIVAWIDEYMEEALGGDY